MNITVFIVSPWEKSSYICNATDRVIDVCNRFLRVDGRHGIMVDGDCSEALLNQRLCDITTLDRVCITPVFKMGEIWERDKDGVYRYVRDYI